MHKVALDGAHARRWPTHFFLILNMQALLIWNGTSSLLKKQKCMFLDTAACWKKMMAHILNTKRSNKNCTDNILICQTSKLLHFSYECIVSRWCCITRWWGRACRAQKPYRFLNLCSETKTLWIQNGIWDQLGINLEDATLQNTLVAKYSVISVLVHPWSWIFSSFCQLQRY